MPLRVGVSAHFMLCVPSPITTSMTSARRLKSTTSMVLPVSVMRTVIFSLFMGKSLALDRFARRSGRRRAAPQWPIHLGGEARQCVEQDVAVQPVQHALALALGGHEARMLQHREVARYRRSAGAEARREVGGGERGLPEERDDLAARQRGQGGEYMINIH